MPSLDKAISNMNKLVKDNTHGYSQAHREGPDYDCSSSVSKALRDAGFPVPLGCNTSSIYYYLLKSGYHIIDKNAALKPGDIWLRRRDTELARAKGSGHIAMMYSSTLVMEFSSSRGHPEKGDQTGTEAWCHPWVSTRKHDFEFLLRYKPSKPPKLHKKTQYYKIYTGNARSIDAIFKAIGAPYGNWKKRKPVAEKNNITNYTGTRAQNIFLMALAKKGKLRRS